jgi:hypothetical protein
VLPCGHKTLLSGLRSMINNSQYSHRLRHMLTNMLNENNTMFKRLKDIENS